MAARSEPHREEATYARVPISAQLNNILQGHILIILLEMKPFIRIASYRSGHGSF